MSVEGSGDGDLRLRGTVFRTAPVDGVGLTDEGTAGREGARDRRGGDVGCRRVGVAGGVTWLDGRGVSNSRRSLTDDALLTPDDLSAAAILLFFAALAPPFLAFDFLFLP